MLWLVEHLVDDLIIKGVWRLLIQKVLEVRLPFVCAIFSAVTSAFCAAALFPARYFINQIPVLPALLHGIEFLDFIDLLVEQLVLYRIVGRSKGIFAEFHAVHSLSIRVVVTANFSFVELLHQIQMQL